MRLALYQPEIPQNTGTILRAAACLGVAVDIIEPCGFVLGEKRMRRAGMDYLDLAAMNRHESWESFAKSRMQADQMPGGSGKAEQAGRLVLLSTKAKTLYTAFSFHPGDTLLLGMESAGVPDEVWDASDAQVKIPMVAGARSLNMAVAGLMVLGEGLRQNNMFPITGSEHAS